MFTFVSSDRSSYIDDAMGLTRHPLFANLYLVSSSYTNMHRFSSLIDNDISTLSLIDSEDDDPDSEDDDFGWPFWRPLLW